MQIVYPNTKKSYIWTIDLIFLLNHIHPNPFANMSLYKNYTP
jgi:hypothetical protein